MMEPDADLDAVARTVVDTAFHLHRDLGPGLLESAYEALLAARLARDGIAVDRQVPVNACFEGVVLSAPFKIDLLVERRIVVELKSDETTSPANAKQVLTYLKLGGYPLGFVINFGTPMFKDGIKRLINNTAPLASWRLGANPKD
jgi:iron complex transport system substrate-binding protein